MTGWSWVRADVVAAVHDRQIAEHGGPEGVRDPGAVASALARPQNLAAYGTPDAADLAAAYAFGLVRNHGFADGNKRTAWIVARLFLANNDCRLRFEKADAIRAIEALAGDALEEAQFAEWIRERLLNDST
jgi:death on curing protein